MKFVEDGVGNTVTAFIVNWKYFNAKDEILLALAVGFTVLTFYNIRKVGMFFATPHLLSGHGRNRTHVVVGKAYGRVESALLDFCDCPCCCLCGACLLLGVCLLKWQRELLKLYREALPYYPCELTAVYRWSRYCGCAWSRHCLGLGISRPLYCAGCALYGRKGILYHQIRHPAGIPVLLQQLPRLPRT